MRSLMVLSHSEKSDAPCSKHINSDGISYVTTGAGRNGVAQRSRQPNESVSIRRHTDPLRQNDCLDDAQLMRLGVLRRQGIV